MGELSVRAQSHYQRIAGDVLAFLAPGDERPVALTQARARLTVKRRLVSWLEQVCTEPGPSAELGSERDPFPEALLALALVQEQLGRVATEAWGLRADRVREALARRLAVDAAAVLRQWAATPDNPAIAAPEPPRAPEQHEQHERATNPTPDSQREAVRALSHAIRNPLNGAMLHATFLERELAELEGGHDLLDAAETIQSEIRRVAELLNEFVDAPLPEARPRARVAVSTLCSRAIELVARDAAARGIEVGADISAEFGVNDALLEVDMKEMLDVLSVLLQQAVEGALAGGGKILLSAHRESDSAIIEVRHDQQSLTTPVPMLRSLLPNACGNDASPGGSGNFNVAVKVMAEHGGSIEVDSQSHRTEFRLRLPIGISEKRAVDRP